MKKYYRIVCLGLLAGAMAPAAERTPIDEVFDRMYRRNFEGAQAVLREYIAHHEGDPLPYGVRAAAYLFSELDRLMILESDFFGDDSRILDKKKLSPDPGAREGVFQSVAKARQLAGPVLKAHPEDTGALFALCISAGIESDYVALVEKRQLASLSYAKVSQKLALRLLKADPKFYDAYLTTGISEYLLGSMPFFVRWFVKFDQTQGSKSEAVRNLELVATKGRYLRPFAKVLLAVIHLREKRFLDAEILLRELHREFPENPLYEREMEKVSNRRKLLPGRDGE
jgi:hypothetical protein